MVYAWILDVGFMQPVQHICIVIDNERNVQESQVEKKNTMAWSHCLFTIPRTRKNDKNTDEFCSLCCKCSQCTLLVILTQILVILTQTNLNGIPKVKIPNAFPVTSLSHIFNTFFLFIICNAIYWAECLNNNQGKTGNEKIEGNALSQILLLLFFFYCSLCSDDVISSIVTAACNFCSALYFSRCSKVKFEV